MVNKSKSSKSKKSEAAYSYSAFYSNRSHRKANHSKKKPSILKPLVVVLIVLALAIGSVVALSSVRKSPQSLAEKPKTTVKTTTPAKTTTPPATTVVTKPATPVVQTQTTACTDNTSGNILVASISQRHLWACSGTQIAYQTAVITGDMNIIADATPVGTFHIYSKQTNTHLIGSDSRGSWNDFVYYWMPFLDNQYGVFGLHDATWRAPTDFGNISPYSDNASHGCIELPLAAAQWIYNWSTIGTPVVIES